MAPPWRSHPAGSRARNPCAGPGESIRPAVASSAPLQTGFTAPCPVYSKAKGHKAVIGRSFPVQSQKRLFFHSVPGHPFPKSGQKPATDQAVNQQEENNEIHS
jgi:hypothetical protein